MASPLRQLVRDLTAVFSFTSRYPLQGTEYLSPAWANGATALSEPFNQRVPPSLKHSGGMQYSRILRKGIAPVLPLDHRSVKELTFRPLGQPSNHHRPGDLPIPPYLLLQNLRDVILHTTGPVASQVFEIPPRIHRESLVVSDTLRHAMRHGRFSQ